MSANEMAAILELLSDKIVSMYKVPKSDSVRLVELSPMKSLLQEDVAYVAHMPLGSLAELVYGSRKYKKGDL